jgi:hypothetical protein
MTKRRILEMANGYIVHLEFEFHRGENNEALVLISDVPGRDSVLLQLEHAVNWLNLETRLCHGSGLCLTYYYRTRGGAPHYFLVRTTKGPQGQVDFFSLEPLPAPPIPGGCFTGAGSPTKNRDSF